MKRTFENAPKPDIAPSDSAVFALTEFLMSSYRLQRTIEALLNKLRSNPPFYDFKFNDTYYSGNIGEMITQLNEFKKDQNFKFTFPMNGLAPNLHNMIFLMITGGRKPNYPVFYGDFFIEDIKRYEYQRTMQDLIKLLPKLESVNKTPLNITSEIAQIKSLASETTELLNFYIVTYYNPAQEKQTNHTDVLENPFKNEKFTEPGFFSQLVGKSIGSQVVEIIGICCS